MINKEVTEFIVVPPYERTAEVLRSKDRFKDYLARKFPGYVFNIVDFSPVGEDEDFHIIPSMMFMLPDGNLEMCEKPPRWLLREMASACQDFIQSNATAASH